MTRPLRPLSGALWQKLHRIGSVAMWVSGLDTLKSQGFRPRTVFDVGVAAGTPDLYAAFPAARYVLVDPTRASLPHMQRLARDLDAEVCNFALGDGDGEIEIEERLDDINGATFFREVGVLGATERYAVPVRRFDRAFPEFERPALCKIDVQGAELMVLRGMGERLADIDVFIVEASVLATIEAAPEAFEVIAFMRERGFVIFDIVGTARRPLDKALAQLDMMFVRENSPLRADRRWAAEPRGAAASLTIKPGAVPGLPLKGAK
ncbi:MAG TPA: FkbM family methyltransferase [Parvibaculum sp.]